MKGKIKAFVAKPKVKWTLFGIISLIVIIGMLASFGIYAAREKQQLHNLGISKEPYSDLNLWINDSLPFNACVKTDCKIIQDGGSFVAPDNFDCNISGISKSTNCSGYDGILHYYTDNVECRLIENDRYVFLADQNSGRYWLALVLCNSSEIRYITTNEVIRNTQANIISKDFDQNYRTIQLNEK